MRFSLFVSVLGVSLLPACEGCGPPSIAGTKGPQEACATGDDCQRDLSCTELNGDTVCVDPTDLDGDGVRDGVDKDIDGDDTPNVQDDDIDGDGTANADDDTARGDADDQSGAQGDLDGDGIPNNLDNDDDQDGVVDGVDGVGSCDGGATQAASEDADCDGFCLSVEGGYLFCDDGCSQTGACAPGSGVPDSDGDGTPDPADTDDDGDGIPDATDPDNTGLDPTDPIGPGEGEGEGEGDDCTNTQFATGDSQIDPRILLVVDKSGSMADPDLAGNRKWDAARSALEQVVATLEGQVDLGLVLFPNGDGNNGACNEGIERVDVGPNHANQIIGVLEGTEPGGGTPTAATLIESLGILQALPDDGRARAVVLATDGGPNRNGSLDGNSCRCVSANQADCQSSAENCLDDSNVISAATQLNAAGFPVFVVGLHGSEGFTDVLNAMANAGGTAQPGALGFYEAGNASDLAGDIEDIAVRVGACRLDLPQNVSPDQVTVTVDGNTVPRDTSRTNGWDLADPNTVELFGAPCAQAVNGGAGAGIVSIQVCSG